MQWRRANEDIAGTGVAFIPDGTEGNSMELNVADSVYIIQECVAIHLELPCQFFVTQRGTSRIPPTKTSLFSWFKFHNLDQVIQLAEALGIAFSVSTHNGSTCHCGKGQVIA